MDVIFVRVHSLNSKYDKFILKNDKIVRLTAPNVNQATKLKRRKIKIYVDGILVHYIVQEFKNSSTFCAGFFRKYIFGCGENGKQISSIKFILTTPPKQIIDYDWNYRTCHMVRERCELDHTLSWLSTLGGAFSALGDYFVNCAEVAGKISYHQLNLALRLRDPNVASRCRLYFSLSLIQRRYFKLARKIVQYEYNNAKNAVIIDSRLIKMCLGIWSKLQYEHKLYKQNRQAILIAEE